MELYEKQIRTLQRKLDRSEQHRAELEELRDRDQDLYKKMHAEIDRARRTIEQKNEELERRNEEILAQRDELETALLNLKGMQAQLIQSEKMASLGQLTAGIAHEIKNPLNFITNFAEVNEELADELCEGLARHPEILAPIADLLADLKQNAAVIKQHGKRADAIVKSMMAHARKGSGERELVDLNALVNEHVELAYHGKRAQEPGFPAQVELDFDETVGKVEMVPQEIGRVVLNLVGNAFDAVADQAARCNDGYVPKVVVRTRRRGEQVELRIEDNGPGIPPDVRKKIFEPFFTTKPTGAGTGLGLSISYDIISQGHGGRLDVEIGPAEGTVFVVRLPASSVVRP